MLATGAVQDSRCRNWRTPAGRSRLRDGVTHRHRPGRPACTDAPPACPGAVALMMRITRLSARACTPTPMTIAVSTIACGTGSTIAWPPKRAGKDRCHCIPTVTGENQQQVGSCLGDGQRQHHAEQVSGQHHAGNADHAQAGA